MKEEARRCDMALFLEAIVKADAIGPGCSIEDIGVVALVYGTAVLSCRACAVWIMNPELLGVPVDQQHAPMCPLRNSATCYPQDVAEIALISERRSRGDTGLSWPDCLPPMFPVADRSPG